jgi:phenylacetate-CoA ligase
MTALADGLLRGMVWPMVDLKNRSVRLQEWRALEESQWDSSRERQVRRSKRLRDTLSHAYATVPFYRQRWPLPRPDLDEDALYQLPVLTKADIREHGAALVSSAFSEARLIEARTGGSTGVALRVLFDRECEDRRNAAVLRSNAWAGWQPAQAAGALWGNPPLAESFRQRLRAAISERFVYLDTVALTTESVAVFVRELRRRKITVLFGHAHSLFIVAQISYRGGFEPPPITAIVSTSMMLLQGERRFIEDYFGCQVTDRYGCEEVGLIAAECERHDGLHINDDHLIVEILREDGTPVGEREVGQVVVTDLLNRGMPLIRYAVGDMSSWLRGACGCGRQMPRLARVLGRTADFLKTADGKLVAGVSLVERTLTAIAGLEQMQLVQQSLREVTVRCVLSPRASEADVSAELVKAIRGAMGPMVNVAVEVVPSLSKDLNGKYRFSICQC